MNTVTYNLHSTSSHSVMNGCLYSFGKSFEAEAISHCLIIVEKIIEKIPLRPKEMVLKCDLVGQHCRKLHCTCRYQVKCSVGVIFLKEKNNQVQHHAGKRHKYK